MENSFYAGNSLAFHFETALHVDILFHVLAHMDLGDDFSNLYSEEYIDRIRQEKNKLGITNDTLIQELNRIKNIYIRYKLHILNFLPFKFDCYDVFMEALECLADSSVKQCTEPKILNWKKEYFTEPEAKEFLRKFIRIMKNENDTFYKAYWQKQQQKSTVIKNEFIDFCTENGTKILSHVIVHEKKEPFIYLSLSMTCNGRGSSSVDFLKAAVKFPESVDDFPKSFFTFIHEVTHQFIDDITLKAIEDIVKFNENDFNAYLIREFAIIYADYLLCKRYLTDYLEQYICFMLDIPQNIDNSKISLEALEKRFLEEFKLPEIVLFRITEYFNMIEK